MDQTKDSIIQYEKRKASGRYQSDLFDHIDEKDQRDENDY